MSKRAYLRMMRQYAELEDRTGKDYSDQIRQVSDEYIAALVAAGEDPVAATASVQVMLDNQRLRFPLVLVEGEGEPVSE